MSCNLNACSVSGHRGDRVCKIGPEPFSPQRAAAVGAPEWTDDSEALQCHGCTRNFTLFRRKHHCRLSTSLSDNTLAQCEISEWNGFGMPDIVAKYFVQVLAVWFWENSFPNCWYIPACCHEKRPLPKYDYMKPGFL
jgi:hypothetical protein